MKMSVRRLTNVLLPLLLLTFAGMALADDQGEGPLDPSQPKNITVDEIVQKFAAREKEFKLAREQYTWRQDVRVNDLDGDTPLGEYRMVTDILFDDRGRRVEQVVFAPQATLQRISMSREDIDDIEKRLPFVLTTDDIQDYSILYVGQQQQDEIHTYVFDIAPKKMEKGRRYFQGRIWVDDKEFQIVKTHGKNVPDISNKNNENLFPAFTTWREQIGSQDGTDRVFWFPTYTKIDDVLHFKTGDVHIRQVVKYTNYKRFGSKIKITYEGQDIGAGDQQPQQGNRPPANAPTNPPPPTPKK
jgi:hypothetical protein